jgi:hypothetical protein
MQIICCKWLIKFSFPLQLIIEFYTVPTLNNWSNIYLVFAADRRPHPSLVCGRHKRLCPSFLDVHYKQPWLRSTNHPPRIPQTVLFRWTLSSHHGPHRERRYPSFLRVHDNQLSLRCNHQPSTFKRCSSWSSSRCTLSLHPSHQFSYSLKGTLHDSFTINQVLLKRPLDHHSFSLHIVWSGTITRSS